MLAGCVAPLDETGRPCPCSAGWTCCVAQNLCQRSAEDCAVSQDGGEDAGTSDPDGGAADAGQPDGGDAGVVASLGFACSAAQRCDAQLTCFRSGGAATRPGVCSRTCTPTGGCGTGFVCSPHPDFASTCLTTCDPRAPRCPAGTACDPLGAFVPSPTQGACVPECAQPGECAAVDARCVSGLCCGARGYSPCATPPQCATGYTLDPVSNTCQP